MANKNSSYSYRSAAKFCLVFSVLLEWPNKKRATFQNGKYSQLIFNTDCSISRGIFDYEMKSKSCRWNNIDSNIPAEFIAFSSDHILMRELHNLKI